MASAGWELRNLSVLDFKGSNFLRCDVCVHPLSNYTHVESNACIAYMCVVKSIKCILLLSECIAFRREYLVVYMCFVV